MLESLSKRSVVDAAYEALRAQILHGAWQPGDAVPTEAILTEQLGVSRSTVREAMNRLASAGLIEIPHGGTKRVLDFHTHAGLEVLSALVVSPAGEVNLTVVRSLTEMRQTLAPDVARLSAERASEDDAAALLELAEALHPSDELVTLLERTMDWWTALVRTSDNLAYRLAYNTLLTTYVEGRSALLPLIEHELRAIELYQSISRAIVERRPDDAERLCRSLVRLGTDAITQAIENVIAASDV